ncbi:DUF305 domain-containing protein [Deinococcus cellulosilyticus]|uniref:DUF305 domain-containing protein n=1 Tax=Deinococcus cellulosilyticus (strain DSM 18568 / NBRC 106333 / KACC 11606 / 5516J-15) TaxID=1223518 RepID=A0A511N4S4_DEIC1|nr:DUF305 domain-containing protein [Deinococcus cellulosilyticus]GEM47850.1 DUF305 domain-containing protein [Deinococcus cellulosilyticus NBRC 106333 = KACC 11606]
MKTTQATLFAVLTLLAGGAGGYLLKAQQSQPTAADVVFAQDMMTHHSQAVDMANRIYVRLLAEQKLSQQDEFMKYLSYDIITSQSNQNGQMLGWLSLWNKPATNPSPMDMQAMGMATPEQVAALSSLPLNEAKTSFLQLMIRHHQGGVMMAEDALKSARTDVVKNMAQRVVQAQTSEIEGMKSMLEKLNAEPLPDLEDMPGMEHGH